MNDFNITRRIPQKPTQWVGFLLGALGIIFLLVIFSPVAIVPPGHRGVMTTFGRPNEKIYPEGIHFKTPIADSMNLVDVSIQKVEGDGEAASKDLQVVHTKIALNYHAEPESAVSIFRDLGNQPGHRIIVPSMNEAVKAVTARFTAEELIAKRTQVRDEIMMQLKERLSRHGIIVDEFSILNFAFSKSFNEAIEAKTTAEQLKLKAERDLQRIRVEAEQKIASAKAEAQALSLQRQQVTSELIRLREVENQTRAIEKWDGHMPQYTGAATPFITISK